MVCVEHLKKSLEIDPEFLEARQDLGRVYVSLDQPENVIEAYQSVLKMDARSADAYTFIGAAQASLEHYGDAEAAARQALRIVPNHPRGRFVLGLSLAAQKKNDSEALRCLADSSEAYPGAHMFAAQVLARRGQTADARRHLETYLPVAPPSERSTVENWLSRLEQRSSVASH
jgi:tetratricopeptide (TPR) repeat protein